MYKQILVAYDGSEGSLHCLNAGAELAKKFDCKVTALWVGGFKPYYHETKGEIDEEALAVENFAKKLRKEIEAFNTRENMEVNFVHVMGNPAKEITNYAKKHHYDLIIIGYKGHSGLWENLLGHVTDKVSEYAHCNVLIVRKK